jgi:DNA ligase-associated metallophosphoesterase
VPTTPISGAAAVAIAGESVLLLPHRAAYWSNSRTLLIADLHLDKCEVMRAHGLPIPRALLEEQISRLEEAIRATGAQRVLALGDLLHAPAGLTGPMVQRFAAWRTATPIEIAIVPGNHDRALARVAQAWRLTTLPSPHTEGPFAFIHDPDQRPARSKSYYWSGHLHPAITIRRAGDSMKLPCFHIGARTAVLPAFSTFTAGGPIDGGNKGRIFGIAGESVLEL